MSREIGKQRGAIYQIRVPRLLLPADINVLNAPGLLVCMWLAHVRISYLQTHRCKSHISDPVDFGVIARIDDS